MRVAKGEVGGEPEVADAQWTMEDVCDHAGVASERESDAGVEGSVQLESWMY